MSQEESNARPPHSRGRINKSHEEFLLTLDKPPRSTHIGPMRPLSLALAPVLLLACSYQKVPALDAVAAQELPCDQAMSVERAGTEGEIYRASGCGKRAYYYRICFGAFSAECKWRRVAERAVDDLKCPAEQVEYEGLERGMVRAWGCGGEGFYRRECEGNTCGWSLTTDPRKPGAKYTAP
jgi:hypothetical protein